MRIEHILRYALCLCAIVSVILSMNAQDKVVLSGRIISYDDEDIEYASVQLKDTPYGSLTNEKGMYHIKAPAGKYIVVVSAIGYESQEKEVNLTGERMKMNVRLKNKEMELSEIVVMATGVGMMRKSAFNAVAVDTKEMQNTTKNLSDALAKAPGLKLRESGGVGSDLSLMLDGFSGKHVKVFIDGVPQEGVGSSFGLNNIPVSFADHIEVYRGVVPVNFGTDAIGGVINVVTGRKRRGWNLDASYSYGSFNTHKSNIDFSQSFRNGFFYQFNAFQNYSDNNYYVDVPVEDFETGRIDTENLVRVKRFHDTYHNEAVVGKVGLVDKAWADRFLLGFTYSHMYQDIQTGVRQKIVYGQKHRHGHSLMPSMEYSKRNLIVPRLNLSLSANYNRDIAINVDTASYKYNWRGETSQLNSPGEQSYQNTRSNNDNWNGRANLTYQIGNHSYFTFNHVYNAFRRTNTSLLTDEEQTEAISKRTTKNISGLSYRLSPNNNLNFTAFGKYYSLNVSGPVATTSNAEEYVRDSRDIDFWGYGGAATYLMFDCLQAKLSYERACRLPTIEELFGDEDLETGDMTLDPERSDNYNFNLSFTKSFGPSSFYIEGGIIYRDTKDYIQRTISSLTGGKFAASYLNYGNVVTKGYNLSARYSFSNWLSIGGNFTRMNVLDNMKTLQSSSSANLNYKERIPNIPYMFADSDVTLTWRGFLNKSNHLSLVYDNMYVRSFTYYSEQLGANKGDYVVPNQFSHNILLSYSVNNGRYNFSVECRNLTDAKLYDNFSLQKAGRAFYGKIRIHFGSR